MGNVELKYEIKYEKTHGYGKCYICKDTGVLRYTVNVKKLDMKFDMCESCGDASELFEGVKYA